MFICEILCRDNDMKSYERKWVTILEQNTDQRDLSASYTVSAGKYLASILFELNRLNESISKIVDVGCGYGGLGVAVARFLGATEIYGIEIDDARIRVARSRNVNVFKTNAENEPLPFDDGSVDLVISFGVAEHLTYWDNFLTETRRVLRDGGYFLVSLPNLRSYIYVLSLLLGYQPRDVEVSKKYLVGVLPIYANDQPAGHVHTVTLKALKQLLQKTGFEVIAAKPLRNKIPNKILSCIDRIASSNASVARRVVVLARKQSSKSGSG